MTFKYVINHWQLIPKEFSKEFTKNFQRSPTNPAKFLKNSPKNLAKYPISYIAPGGQKPFRACFCFYFRKTMGWPGNSIDLHFFAIGIVGMWFLYRIWRNTIGTCSLSKKAMWLDKKQTMKHLNFYTFKNQLYFWRDHRLKGIHLIFLKGISKIFTTSLMKNVLVCQCSWLDLFHTGQNPV